MTEYLIRVQPHGDAFVATLRQFHATAHPEVRAVVGPVARGEGANVPAAMVAAIANAHIECLPAAAVRSADGH